MTRWAILLIAALPATAYAAEWQPVARSCVEEIETRAGCTTACVNSLWKEVVRCTNDRLRRRFPEDQLSMCIHRVEKARSPLTPELVGDPVKEVFQSCLGG